MENALKCSRSVGTKAKLIPPEATSINKRKCTKKIGIALEEIEKGLEDIVFYTRCKGYGAIEVRFANE